MKSNALLPHRVLRKASVAELQFALIQRAQAARSEALAEAQMTVRYLERKIARGASELARLRTAILAEHRRRDRRKSSR